jgi:hypothetical protein
MAFNMGWAQTHMALVTIMVDMIIRCRNDAGHYFSPDIGLK